MSVRAGAPLHDGGTAAGEQEVRAWFARGFGGAVPTVVASAPARVNLIGEHTDYNGGEVLPIAIARRTFVALRPVGGRRTRCISATEAVVGEFDATSPVRQGGWWDYVAGVTDQLRQRGMTLPAFELAVWSDVPAGAGLSSSAALEVATALAMARAIDAPLSIEDAAVLSQRAECDFVGVQCGIMDQYASALGRRAHALHVWCDSGRFEHVPFAESVLIFDTAVPRSLRASAFNARRAECDAALALLRTKEPALRSLAAAEPEFVRTAGLPDVLARRALHVSEETRRVRRTVAALAAGAAVPGELLVASHASLRDLYECSSPELDWFVTRAMAADGITGARLTGAGWGGCAIAVGDAGALAAAAPGLARDHEAAFDRAPRIWITRAEDGARVDA